MNRMKRDLVVHYDEENQKIVFFTTETSNIESIRAKAIEGICPDVEFFKALPPESAEQKIGRLLFAILDLHSSQKINIRAYESEAQEATKQWEQDGLPPIS